MMDMRQQRGKQIAETMSITRTEKGWKVPSQSRHGSYFVSVKSILSQPECTCPDYETRKLPCKHIFAVEYITKKEVDNDGNVTITQTKRIIYPQNWSAYNLAQQTEKELFIKLLHDLTKDVETPQKFGRPTLPLSDVIFSCAYKVYTLFSGRRFATDMKEVAQRGYTSDSVHYNSMFRYFQNPNLTPILVSLIEQSSLPLKSVEHDFAVDSSGFFTSKFDRYFSVRYGKTVSDRDWVKAHVAIGVKTNIVTAVKLLDWDSADHPNFKHLVNGTAKNFKIEEVSADKAYSSRENLQLVWQQHGGTPYIPFKKNVTGKQFGSKIWGKMFHYYMLNREEFLQHYHKRSNVESTFSMIKAKFGDSIKSRKKTAQINEVLCKILCHNICVVIQSMYELGIEPNFI